MQLSKVIIKIKLDHAFKKILATCGIRKLLDFVFTQRELFWLDDILPGLRKKAHAPEAEEGKAKSAKNKESADNFLKQMMANKETYNAAKAVSNPETTEDPVNSNYSK